MGFDPRIEAVSAYFDKKLAKKAAPKRIKRDSALRRKVYERDQGVCCQCQRYDAKWEHDHIVSLAIGGSDDLANSRTLCRRHHAEKTSTETTARAKADRLAEREALTRQRRKLSPA